MKYVLVCSIWFIVFGACNHPKSPIELSLHQVDSVLESNSIQHHDIKNFVSVNEKKTTVEKWLVSQDTTLQDLLLVHANKRISILKQQNVYTAYLLWKKNKRVQSWQDLLTKKEKKLLISDSPKYWLPLYDSLNIRKQAVEYDLSRNYLQKNELRQWIEEGEISAEELKRMALERRNKIIEDERIREQAYRLMVDSLQKIIYPVHIENPFGSSELFSGLTQVSYSKMYLETTEPELDYFKDYQPLLEKVYTEGEDMEPERFLPFIETHFNCLSDIELDLYKSLLDEEVLNPGLFSYRLEDIKNFEVYLYTIPEDFDGNHGLGVIILYNRETKTGYSFFGFSDLTGKYVYIENDTITIGFSHIQDTGEEIFQVNGLYHQISIKDDQVYITEFLPFSEIENAISIHLKDENYDLLIEEYHKKGYKKTFLFSEYKGNNYTLEP